MTEQIREDKISDNTLNLDGFLQYFSGNISKQDRCITALRLCLKSAEEDIEWTKLKFDSDSFEFSFDNNDFDADLSESALSLTTVVDESNAEHSLMVELFTIFFGSNPFMGCLFYKSSVINNKLLNDIFVTNRKFIFSNDNDNHPDPHYQAHTIELWNSSIYAKLREIMSAYFIDNILPNRNELVNTIWGCLASIVYSNSPIMYVLFEESEKYAISYNKKLIHPTTYETLGIGIGISSNSVNQKCIGLQNLTNTKWTVTTASGKENTIGDFSDTHNSFPLRAGMKCSTNNTNFSII